MPQTKYNNKDVWSGVIFVFVGIAAILFALRLPMGTAMRMGPAYFPTMLGGLLALIGISTIIRGLVRPGAHIGQFACGKIILITVAIVLFGLLLRPLGLVAAIVILVMLSASASLRFRWPVALALALSLAIFSSICFSWLLGLPLRILGPWLGGY
ncbi:MAG: tripartite tricarboxylate transporter TctB family protein [Syntrophales bacterium]